MSWSKRRRRRRDCSGSGMVPSPAQPSWASSLLLHGISKHTAKRDTVTVQVKPVPSDRQDKFYVGLQWNELLGEIKECAKAITSARGQISAEMRKRLLPALLELKKRTFRKHPGYYETLRAINLNPGTVRQWFYRGRTGDEIVALIGEEPKRRVIRTNRVEPKPIDPRDLYIEHLDRVVDALLADKIVLAKRLATEYLKVRQEKDGLT
jgi:hypothetical protein